GETGVEGMAGARPADIPPARPVGAPAPTPAPSRPAPGCVAPADASAEVLAGAEPCQASGQFRPSPGRAENGLSPSQPPAPSWQAGPPGSRASLREIQVREGSRGRPQASGRCPAPSFSRRPLWVLVAAARESPPGGESSSPGSDGPSKPP